MNDRHSQIRMNNKDISRDLRIDTLRGLAICGVVAVHTSQDSDLFLSTKHNYSAFEVILRNTLDYGLYGVDLFFLISGFLLAMNYIKTAEFGIANYAMRRAARIWPLWTLFGLLYFCSSGILELHGHSNGFFLSSKLYNETGNWQFDSALVLFSHLTFTTWLLTPTLWNVLIPGGWSIQSEVAHYVVFPLIRKLRVIDLVFLISLSGIFHELLSVVAGKTGNRYADYLIQSLQTLGIFTTLPFFLLGIIIFRAQDNTSWVVPKGIDRALAFTLLPGVCLFLSAQLPVGYVWIALALTLLAWTLTKHLHIGRFQILMSKFGRYSFFIYFAHFPLSALFSEVLSGSTWFKQILFSFGFPFVIFESVLFLAVSGSSLFFGILSWKYLEKPVIDHFR